MNFDEVNIWLMRILELFRFSHVRVLIVKSRRMICASRRYSGDFHMVLSRVLRIFCRINIERFGESLQSCFCGSNDISDFPRNSQSKEDGKLQS